MLTPSPVSYTHLDVYKRQFLRFYTLMRRDAWKFNYLSGTGGKLICEPLAARAQALGSDIRLGCRATRLEAVGEQWRVVYSLSLIHI